jgi:MFS family permease
MINICLPDIVQDLNITSSLASFIVTILLLVTSSAGIVSGKMADRVGSMRMFKLGQIIATAAFVAALGVNSYVGTLIVSGVAGLGFGASNATTNAIFRQIVRPGKLSTAIGINVLIFALARIVGPILGGILLRTDFGWRSVYWVMVLFQVLGVFVQMLLPTLPTSGLKEASFDYFGAVLFTVLIGESIFAIASLSIPFVPNWATALCAILAVLIVPLLLFWEDRTPIPIIPTRVLRDRRIALPLFGSFASFVGSSAATYLNPWVLRTSFELDERRSGRILALSGLLIAVSSAFASKFNKRYAFRNLATTLAFVSTFSFFAIGVCYCFSLTGTVLSTVLLALGCGMFTVVATAFVIEHAPLAYLAVTGSFVSAFKNVGMSVGTAAAAALQEIALARLWTGPIPIVGDDNYELYLRRYAVSGGVTMLILAALSTVPAVMLWFVGIVDGDRGKRGFSERSWARTRRRVAADEAAHLRSKQPNLSEALVGYGAYGSAANPIAPRAPASAGTAFDLLAFGAIGAYSMAVPLPPAHTSPLPEYSHPGDLV